MNIFAVKFLFLRYIVCWGKFYCSKIIGGGGGVDAPSHLRLLICKIVYSFEARNLEFSKCSEIFKCQDFMNTLRNLAKSDFACILARFKYLAKQFI